MQEETQKEQKRPSDDVFRDRPRAFQGDFEMGRKVSVMSDGRFRGRDEGREG